MCFEGEKWAMNSDLSEIEGRRKRKPSSNKNLLMVSVLMEVLA